jgi:hypothetical protein
MYFKRRYFSQSDSWFSIIKTFLWELFIIYLQCNIISNHLTSGAGTAYPSGAPEFTSGFIGVRVTRSLVLCACFVDRCLFFCTFSFGHCYLFFFDIRILITPLVSSNSFYSLFCVKNSNMQSSRNPSQDSSLYIHLKTRNNSTKASMKKTA